jgi:phage terminase large subunit
MDIEVSETFAETYKAYHEVVNQDEIDLTPNVNVKPIYKYRQIVSMGGTRSSKSYSILQLLLLEMINRKKIKITVWRNLKNVCRTSVLEDFEKIITFDYKIYKDIKYNKYEGTFTYLPTGSKIVFEGADTIEKVLGGTQDISFFNEISEFNKRIYLEITQRTSDRVFCDYNPSKSFWLEPYRNDPETIFLHSTYEHNAFCPPNIVKQIRGYEPWETGSYEIRGFELFYNGAPIGIHNQPPPHVLNWKKGTADEYMWLVYGLGIGAEKPNKIYKGWNEISQQTFDDLDYTSYFGLDFGASNPTACVEVKYDGDGAFYMCERLYTPLQDITDSLPTVIKLRVPQAINGQSYIVCDSARQSYIDLLANEGYMAIGAVKGGGSVEVGISLIQGFTIYYVPTPNFKFEYDNYSWTIDKYLKSTDVPMKVDDHLMDAMRYIISYLVPLLSIPT